jgi:hypothetical protein
MLRTQCPVIRAIPVSTAYRWRLARTLIFAGVIYDRQSMTQRSREVTSEEVLRRNPVREKEP